MSWNERSLNQHVLHHASPRGAIPQRSRFRAAWARAGLAIGLIASALACGDSFPNMFLLRGDEVVLTASPMSFRPLIEPLVPNVVGTIVALPKARYAFVPMQSDEGADLAAARASGARNLAEFDLYQQGRAAFAANDHAAARAAWERLLALPAADRAWRSVWASYMLGRSWHHADPARAAGYYARTRELAAEGFADTLGLATASIGWEARLAYERRELVRAIALYIEQAAAKDPSAMMSLWRCGNRVHQLDDAGLDALARDGLARRVVTAWMVSEDLAEGAVYDRQVVRPATIGARWLAAVERAGANDVAFADILAWAAYQAGDFAKAATWAELAPNAAPRAAWVRSKLALRRGDVREATAMLVSAVRAMPPAPPRSADPADGGLAQPADRLLAAGEAGVLLLTMRQYEEALEFFIETGEMHEASYIAERVLTIDELATIVDRRRLAATEGDTLAHVLARRLARDGQYGRAERYLPARLQPLLARFSECLSAGRDAARARTERARSLVEAARIARHHGLELLGTELGPDSASTNGGVAESDMLALRSEMEDAHLVAVQPEERRRAESTALRPWRRFHYRYIGCDLAWEAAALMPDGSVETAAVLCEAGSWIKILNPKEADRFYKAMVKRCGKTQLGRQAEALRWFPPLAQSDMAFADLMPIALHEPDREDPAGE
jgi:hypothetical protein